MNHLHGRIPHATKGDHNANESSFVGSGAAVGGGAEEAVLAGQAHVAGSDGGVLGFETLDEGCSLGLVDGAVVLELLKLGISALELFVQRDGYALPVLGWCYSTESVM